MNPRLSFEQLAAIASKFNPGAVTAIEPATSDPLAGAYKVTSSNGAFVLKRHSFGKTEDELLNEELLLEYLSANGFDLAPQMVRTGAGGRHLSVDGSLWSATVYVASDPPFDWKQPAWTAAHCVAAGQALARLHFCGQDFQEHLCAGGDAGRKLIPPAAGYLPEYLEAALSPAASLAELERAEPGCAGRLVAGAYESASRCSLLSARTGQNPVLVHGDYHPGNLLFLDKKPVCMLDFAYAHADDPAVDLGYAALFFCFTWAGRANVRQVELEYDLFDSLLDGYLREIVRLDWQAPAAAALAESPDRRKTLQPYIELAAYLTCGWLLSALQIAGQGRRDSLREALKHMLGALKAL